MRAMAAPSAGDAETCGAKVNERAHAAARVNKVVFICFLLDVCRCPNSGRGKFAAGHPANRNCQLSRCGKRCALTQISIARTGGAHGIWNLRFKPYWKSHAGQVLL